VIINTIYVILFQVFSERYSNFLPALYGACGRVIVVEYVGPSLSSALDRPWQERVKLSIKLIQLARTFTRTEDKMALYMYDVVMSNFAVDKHGNVKLIDCEHVLIADMSAINHTYGKFTCSSLLYLKPSVLAAFLLTMRRCVQSRTHLL
jgi:hypothetical protein